jgi:hypothetical protein
VQLPLRDDQRTLPGRGSSVIPEFQVEPDAFALKAEIKRLREERDAARKECREWKKQVAELTKKVGAATVDENPLFHCGQSVARRGDTMFLNPWKRARQLRGIITSLQTFIGTLQKVIETQGKVIAAQRLQIEALTTVKATVTTPARGEYLN